MYSLWTEEVYRCSIEIQYDPAIFRCQRNRGMNRIFQCIGENRGHIHIGNRKLFWYLDRILKINSGIFDLWLMCGKDHIDQLIFAVTMSGSLVRSSDDLMNIVLCPV